MVRHLSVRLLTPPMVSIIGPLVVCSTPMTCLLAAATFIRLLIMNIIVLVKAMVIRVREVTVDLTFLMLVL